MTLMLSVCTALMGGLLMTRLFSRLNLPDVTAYLVAGVLLGPCCLGQLGIHGIGFPSFGDVSALSLFNDTALSFIAFAIGSEFRLSHLKETGSRAAVIGVLQAVITTVVVDVVLFIVHLIIPQYLSLAQVLVFGAIAAATAPAATLMVVRQYNAHGDVTDTLLPVVAIDDAVGLILFSVSYGIAQSLNSGSVSAITLFVDPLCEIVVSILIGSFLGWCLTHMARWFHSRQNRISMIIGFIFLSVAVCKVGFNFGPLSFELSPLLVNMMIGTVFCNCCKHSADLMDRADSWSAPLLTLFFVLSGAELDLSAFSNVIVLGIGLVYIIARCLGKYFGASLSSVITKAPPMVHKYLGVTLFPQAGVALGMAATVGASMGPSGVLVRNVVLFGVLIYELLGPSLTKWALTKAGEIKPVSKQAPVTDQACQ